MRKTDNLFYNLDGKECDAVVLTEGVVFVCALKAKLDRIKKMHVRFLTEVLQVPVENISFPERGMVRSQYAIVTIDSLSSYDELAELTALYKDKGLNLYCIGAPSEWVQICKNVTISCKHGNISPNIAIDCTEHKPNFYRSYTNNEIVEAQHSLMSILSALAMHKSQSLLPAEANEDSDNRYVVSKLMEIISALISRKRPVLIHAETQQDYNYIELFRMQFGNKGVVYLNKIPDEETLRNASKIIMVRNAGSNASVDGLMDFVDNIPILLFDKIHVVLYSFFKEDEIIQWELDARSILYTNITPSRQLRDFSISDAVVEVKQLLTDTLYRLVYEY